MKRILLISLASTLAMAEPYYTNNSNYNSNIQWSRQANIYANQSPSVQHQQQQIKKLYAQPYKQTVYKTKKTIPPFSQTSQANKVDILVGGNIFLDNDDIDNAIATGIRYSRLISGSNYIQVGYEGVFGADYHNIQSISAYAKDENNDNYKTVTTFGELDFNRLYLNAMHEFLNYKALYPYVYAGLGFEFVSEDDISLENSSFFQTGLGLRYDVGQTYSLLSDVKALKRLNGSGDMDIVATVGLGIAFGQKTKKRSVQRKSTPSKQTITKTRQFEPKVQAIIQPQYDYQETVKPEYIQAQQDTISDETYYIQMGAFESDRNIENSNYTSRINNIGLNTTMKQVYRNGHSMNLLLIGPYYSEGEARADLIRAKRVVKDAFIKKIVD